ncbi:MAG: cob(I)yrinic acid a,c-diamide adenosyltransferase [Bacteroidetes bacterium]|nr:cob(I)yrinic acid a,c-diamide adenosyltransferase [Bacteroidota bacterium]
MKIYTKTGDKGQTSLIGGTRVPKHHIRIEAYGTVDELNSYLGLLRDMIVEDHTKKLLVDIQDRLFTIGSILASDPEKSKMKIPELKGEDVTRLEKEIDAIDAVVLPMKHFVLPGGHLTVSHCHIARCICRRAERNITHLAEQVDLNELIIQYFNRLSDYLFMLSRKLSHDLGAEEIPWLPKLD